VSTDSRPPGHRSTLRIRPTRVGAVTLLLAVMIGLISLRASNPWLLLVACALLAPVLLSVLFRPDLSAISVSFAGADRVIAGDLHEQSFHVRNRGRTSSPALQLEHRARGFEPLALAVPALPPGGTADLRLRRPALVRGLTRVHEVGLWTTAPFGMALCQRLFLAESQTGPVSVHPARGPVAVLPAVLQGAGGGRPNRLGDEPHELREWRRGDSLRQVHWRATARHDRLTVVVPENTVRSRLALVVLGSRDVDAEALISTAAWTAVEAVRSDGIVRLSATGSPEYVGDDPGAVLDWFAALEPQPTVEPAILGAAAAWAGSAGSVLLAAAGPEDVAQFDAGLLLLTPDGRVALS
jgi:uncharacterized protein (DUF58 family)